MSVILTVISVGNIKLYLSVILTVISFGNIKVLSFGNINSDICW